MCDAQRANHPERERCRGWSVFLYRSRLHVSDDQTEQKPSIGWVPSTMFAIDPAVNFRPAWGPRVSAIWGARCH